VHELRAVLKLPSWDLQRDDKSFSVYELSSWYLRCDNGSCNCSVLGQVHRRDVFACEGDIVHDMPSWYLWHRFGAHNSPVYR